MVVRALSKRGDAQLTQFFLTKDMPHFRAGCFTCFMHGADKCPHAASVKPIADAIPQSRPSHSYLVRLRLRRDRVNEGLLDHLCYMWMSHRPAPQMFTKVALTVVTTAGAESSHATKTLRNGLSFWGCRRVYSLKTSVSAMRREEVSEKRKAKIERRADALAERIARAVKRGKHLPYPPLRRLIYKMMAAMQKTNDWNQTDRAHWE